MSRVGEEVDLDCYVGTLESCGCIGGVGKRETYKFPSLQVIRGD